MVKKIIGKIPMESVSRKRKIDKVQDVLPCYTGEVRLIYTKPKKYTSEQ